MTNRVFCPDRLFDVGVLLSLDTYVLLVVGVSFEFQIFLTAAQLLLYAFPLSSLTLHSISTICSVLESLQGRI